MSRQRLLSTFAAVLFAAAGCGSNDGGGGQTADASPSSDGTAGGADGAAAADARVGPDAEPSPFAEHIITPACAPDDGPALRIVLTSEVDADCNQDPLAPYVEIVVYTGTVDAPETITWSSQQQNGYGSHCLGGDAPCLSPMEGQVRFQTFTEDVGASGSWRLGTGNDAEEGTFGADWCTPETPIVCG